MVEQETWNLVFGWLTGKKCLIPEGCPPPLEGVVLYTVAAAILAAAVYWIYRRFQKWKRS